MINTSLGENGAGKLLFSSTPKRIAVTPSNSWASPRVISMIASRGCPVIGRRAKRSISRPMPIETISAAISAAHRGRSISASPASAPPPVNHHVRNAPNITRCPWAKLNTSDDL